MAITAVCFNCSTAYNIDETKLPSGSIKLRCSNCGEMFEVDNTSSLTPTEQPPVEEAAPETLQGAETSNEEPAPVVPTTEEPAASAARGGHKILIATEDDTIGDRLSELFSGQSIEVLKAYDGVEALEIVEKERPEIAVLDVALQKLYGFEVCEHIKGSDELKDTVVFLLASIYDKKRYRRPPASLYGADEYLERHQLENYLVKKVIAIMGEEEEAEGAPTEAALEAPIEPPSIEQPPVPEQSVSAPQSAAQAEHDTTPPPAVETEQPIERKAEPPAMATAKAPENDEEAGRKLARIIVSDIILYNSEEVQEGMKNGTLFKLLEDDIKDGLKYIRKRVPAHLPAEEYLKEAFEEFVTKKKEEMGLKDQR